MNFLRLKRANWLALTACLALIGGLSSSCSKETTKDGSKHSNKLVISVVGINDGDNNRSENKSSLSSHKQNTAPNVDHKVYEFEDVDMAVSIGDNLSGNAALVKKVDAKSGLIVTSPLSSEIKYVVYIYDQNTLVASSEFQVGTAGTIEGLEYNGSYRWVALSYNSVSTAPSLSPPSGTINPPQNTDVLYASGNIDLSVSSSISIIFSHAFSRIAIELNTIGIFGEIEESPSEFSVSGLNLATGSINLVTGEITAGANYIPTLSYADFSNVHPVHRDAKIAYVYTAATGAQNITVLIKDLKIRHVDGSNLIRTYFTTATPFVTSVTPELGKTHHVLINLIESALTTNYNNNMVKWARSNLFYRGDNGRGRNYAFYANNTQTARADGYFSFGGTIPMKFATNATQGDPCALVYPAGLWRQPVKSDFENLVRGDIEINELTGVLGPLGGIVDATGVTGLLNVVTNLLGNVVFGLVNVRAPNSSLAPTSPYNYGQYTISGGAPSSGSNAFGNANSSSNNLRFYYNGLISNVNVLQEVADGDGLLNVGLNDISADISSIQILNLNLPLLDSYGRATAFWTKEQGANILGLVEAGSWGYYGNAGRGLSILPLLSLGSRYHMANNTGEVLNGVKALGIGLLSTSLKNVRCVRN